MTSTDLRDMPPFFRDLVGMIISSIHQEFKHFEERIMTAVEDLKAADVTLDETVVAVLAEVQHFMADVATRLEGDDPDIAGVTADIQTQSQQLQDVISGLKTSDPIEGTGGTGTGSSGDAGTGSGDTGAGAPAAA